MLPAIISTAKGKIFNNKASISKVSLLSIVIICFILGSPRILKAADKVWYLHFNEDTGTLNTGTSLTGAGGAGTFLSKPYPNTSFGTLKVSANEGGSFTQQNPGIDAFGANSELKISASSGTTPTKFSEYGYTPGKSFYIKYSIRWDGSSTGEQYFFAGGAGASYSNNNLPAESEIFSGLKVTYGTSNSLILEVKNGSSWVSLGSVSLTQNTNYTIEIFGNNTNSSSAYNYGSNATTCGSQSIAAGTYDLYINGALAGNDITKGGMNSNASVFNFMFYGINSPDNTATFYLDDIIWSNGIPSSPLTPIYAPTQFTITDTTSTSYKVNFTAANSNPHGYVVLRKSGSTPTNTPSDFTNYIAGDIIGGDTVIYAGAGTSFDVTSLVTSTEYYFKIFPYNGEGSCRSYLTTSPLTGSASTLDDEAVAAFISGKTGSWHSAATWEYEYKPGKFKTAKKIPTKKNKSIAILRNHSITAGNIEASLLTIEPNASLEINGNITITDGTDENDMVNEGTVTITGSLILQGKMQNKTGSKVTFSGSEDQNIPAGTYEELAVSTGGEKNLSGNIKINKSLNINNVSINTGSFTLTFDSSATIQGEDADHYVKGKLKIAKTVNRKRESFNNIGVTIDATSNNQDLGTVTITRSVGAPVYVSTSSSISRSWSIEPESQPTQSVELTLAWNATDESLPFDLNYMQVWKSPDHGTSWQTLGDLQPAFTRSITVTTSSFSDWTVSDYNNVLPNNFKYFNGKENTNGSLLLKWSAEEKLQSEGFVIEKSLNGRNFEAIGLVQPFKHASDNKSYEYIDKGFFVGAYYRIKQTGINSKADYSSIIFIPKGEVIPKLFSIYPNPIGSSAKIRALSDENMSKEIDLTVFASNGKEIFNKTGNLNDINSLLPYTIEAWAKGTYFIEIKHDGKSEQLKVLKK